MVTASGSGSLESAKKPRPIDIVPTRPRQTWLGTLLLLSPSRSCPVQPRNTTTGKIPKNERKNTSSPAGIPCAALSSADITRKMRTDPTLKAIPVSGDCPGECIHRHRICRLLGQPIEHDRQNRRPRQQT